MHLRGGPVGYAFAAIGALPLVNPWVGEAPPSTPAAGRFLTAKSDSSRQGPGTGRRSASRRSAFWQSR